MVLLLEETAQDDRFNPEAMAASNSSARIDPAIVVGFPCASERLEECF